MKLSFRDILSGVLLCLSCIANSTYAATQALHTFADSSALATGYWVKIALNADDNAIYEVSYKQLRSMGFQHPERVAVYGFGGNVLDEDFSTGHIDDVPELAICNDAQQQRILFYGMGNIRWSFNSKTSTFQHKQHPYSTYSCYFLHEKEEPLRSIDTLVCASGADSIVTTFTQYECHELEDVNIGKTGKNFYGESFLFNTTQDFTFDGYKENTLVADVNFVANALTASQLSLKYKNNQVAVCAFSSIDAKDSYTKGTQGNISDSIHNIEEAETKLRLTFVGGNSCKTAYLNYIRVQGQKTLLPEGTFRNIEAQNKRIAYQFQNLASYSDSYLNSATVWDVTDPQDIKIQQTSNGQFTSPYRGVREYAIAANGGKYASVTSLGVVPNQNLHALPQTNMIIIVAPAFKQQAEELAAYRRLHDGLHVTVVTPEQIYNEFSSGVPDATAYRLFAKMFHDREAAQPDAPKLQYLLLFGDSNYNNRAITQSATKSNKYLLCYESDASLVETSSCVCDDYFGFLDDNEGSTLRTDKLDVGIGRLPVHSETEAQGVLEKIIRYSDNSHYGNWKNTLCFLADDGDDNSPNLHMKHADSLVYILQQQNHNEFVYKKIYLDAYNRQRTASGTAYPDAKKAFLETLRQGALLINYSGHGDTHGITHEHMMTTNEAANLSMKNLPVWITATCDFSRYDDDETSCGETLLLNPNGGAAAMITTTRVVYASNNLWLNLNLISNLFNKHSDGTRYRMGDIMRQAKLGMLSDFNKLNFCLLGDPSMTLSYPEYEIELTEINGNPVNANTQIANLSPLQKVTMRGRVKQLGNEQTDSTFNGLIYPTIYDAEERITAVNNDNYDKAFQFNIRDKKVFSGRDMIRNGEFEYSFVMPKDLSYSDKTALINLYAFSDNGDEGQGFYNKLMLLDLTESTAEPDSMGPVIKQIYLNDESFKNGSLVNSTPYFFAQVEDEHGFNTTGASIGHDVSITIKRLDNVLSNINQYILNDYFTTFTGQSSRGNIRYSIPEMEDGEYQLTFRIWDTYNNATDSTLFFTVGTKAQPDAMLINAYPSPAVLGENITFRVLHNRPESNTNVTIQVYTQTGTKVMEKTLSNQTADVVYIEDVKDPSVLDSDINADEKSALRGVTQYTWNQKDSQGAHIAPGMYLYRVYMDCNGSVSTSRSQILMVAGKQ